jgi:predicted XRE-type DNA-binding protein
LRSSRITARTHTGCHHESGNVFADPGLPDAEERLVKAELARQILNIIA